MVRVRVKIPHKARIHKNTTNPTISINPHVQAKTYQDKLSHSMVPKRQARGARRHSLLVDDILLPLMDTIDKERVKVEKEMKGVEDGSEDVAEEEVSPNLRRHGGRVDCARV